MFYICRYTLFFYKVIYIGKTVNGSVTEGRFSCESIEIIQELSFEQQGQNVNINDEFSNLEKVNFGFS